jgi:hypothetical protein
VPGNSKLNAVRADRRNMLFSHEGKTVLQRDNPEVLGLFSGAVIDVQDGDRVKQLVDWLEVEANASSERGELAFEELKDLCCDSADDDWDWTGALSKAFVENMAANFDWDPRTVAAFVGGMEAGRARAGACERATSGRARGRGGERMKPSARTRGLEVAIRSAATANFLLRADAMVKYGLADSLFAKPELIGGIFNLAMSASPASQPYLATHPKAPKLLDDAAKRLGTLPAATGIIMAALPDLSASDPEGFRLAMGRHQALVDRLLCVPP